MVPENHGLRCPGCGTALASKFVDPQVLGAGSSYRATEVRVHGCYGCGGAWVDTRTLDEMIARVRPSIPVDLGAVVRKTMTIELEIVYRTCPCCRQQMHRRNFARISGVIVDECRSCGTYFDAGELEDVLAFVHSGGLTLATRRRSANPGDS